MFETAGTVLWSHSGCISVQLSILSSCFEAERDEQDSPAVPSKPATIRGPRRREEYSGGASPCSLQETLADCSKQQGQSCGHTPVVSAYNYQFFQAVSKRSVTSRTVPQFRASLQRSAVLGDGKSISGGASPLTLPNPQGQFKPAGFVYRDYALPVIASISG